MTKFVSLTWKLETGVTHSNEEIHHEEYIKGKVYLLSFVGCPRYTGLNSITEKVKLPKENFVKCVFKPNLEASIK